MKKILEIEIKSYGIFKVKNDYTHRYRSRLVLFNKNRFKEVQYDSLDRNLRNEIYQEGYDYYGESIQIRIKKTTE